MALEDQTPTGQDPEQDTPENEEIIQFPLGGIAATLLGTTPSATRSNLALNPPPSEDPKDLQEQAEYGVAVDSLDPQDTSTPPSPTTFDLESGGDREVEKATSPDIYLASSSPPVGWTPSRVEIDRLLEEKLLSPYEAKDPQKVWDAGRASQTRRGGTDWVGKKAGQYLRHRAVSGESFIQNLIHQQVEIGSITKQVREKTAIDPDAAWELVWKVHTNKLQDEDLNQGKTRSKEDFNREVERRTQRSLSEFAASRSNILWIHPDTNELIDDIQDDWLPIKMIRVLANSIPLSRVGPGDIPDSADARVRAHAFTSGPQVKVEGLAYRIARASPSTWLAPKWFGGHAIGSREWTESILAGDDITQHIDEMGEALGRYIPGERFDRAAGVIATLGIIAFEPDLGSFLLTGPGYAAKGLRLAKTNRKLLKAAQFLDEMSTVNATGAKSLDQISDELEAFDEAIFRAIEMEAASNYRTVGGLEGATLGSTGAASNVYKKLGEMNVLKRERIAEARKLEAQAVTEEGKAALALKKQQIAEIDLAQAYILREHAETLKNNFLVMQGMSPEKAAAIVKKKDAPVVGTAARDTDKLASDLEKKAEEIRKDPIVQQKLKEYDEAATDLASLFDHMVQGFRLLPEARRVDGKLRRGWDILSTEGKRTAASVSSRAKPIRVPTIGSRIRVPTETGGTRIAEVERIRITGPGGKPRLARGNENEIIIELTDGSTFKHPFRLDKPTAKRLKTKIDRFDELHELVSAEGGIVSQMLKMREDAAAARRLAEQIRTAGPHAKRLQAFEEATERLREASKAYKEASKEAGVAARSRDKAVKKWVGQSEEAVRAEIHAVETARIREHFGEAIKTVRDGLENFRVAGLTRLKAHNIYSSPRKFARAALNLRKLDDEAIQSFGMKIDDEALFKEYQELRKKVTSGPVKHPTKEVGIEFDSASLLRELETLAGDRKAVSEFLASDRGKSLKWIFETGAKTPHGRLLLDTDTASKVLSDVRTFLREAKGRELYTESVAVGRLVYDAWDDLQLFQKGKSNLNRGFVNTLIPWGNWRRGFRNAMSMAKRRGASFDNVQERIGRYTKEVEDAFVSTERLLSRGRMELIEISRMEALGGTPAERFEVWLDSFAEVNLKEGKPRWNLATGNGSPYQKGAQQMAADYRTDPRRLEDARAAGETKAIQLRAKLRRLIETARKGRGKIVGKGEEITLSPKFLDELERGIDQITGDLVSRVTESAQYGKPSRTLQAVSRMWLARGKGRPIAVTEDDAILLALARHFLGNSNTFGKEVNALGEVIDEGFSAKMRNLTFALRREVDTNVDRVNALASSAFMASASIGTLGYRLQRASGISIKASVAADINRIFEGNMAEVKNPEAAYDALNRMGMPFSQDKWTSSGRQIAGFVKDVSGEHRRLIQMGTTKGGSSIVPQNMVEALEARAEDLVKELRVASIRGVEPLAARMYGDYLAAWRGSAVTGLIIPNPRYWTNNIMGDFSQMWMEAGLWQASKRSFYNLPTNLPFFGRRWQEMNLYMAEQVAGKSGRGEALPGILSSALNPFLGRVFKGEKGHFFTKNGEPITFDQLRRWALEDGISESFVREELMQMYGRTADDFKRMGREMYDWWQGQIYDHAALVQERQRMGFYADLLQRGYSRKEAAERTKRALYDWSHGIAEWEGRTLSRIIPFWRFWRLGMKQLHYSFLEPFVSPSGAYLKKAALGNTKLARMRQQLLIWPSLPEFIYENNAHAGMSLQEQTDMLAHQMGKPGYYQTRPSPGAIPYDPVRREAYLRRTGKDMTHRQIIMPPATVPDLFDMGTGLWTGLFLTLNKFSRVKGIFPGADSDPIFDIPMRGDVGAQFFEPILGGLAPGWETMARSVASTWGADLDFEMRSSDRYLSPDEEMIWKKFAPLRAQMKWDNDSGRYKVSTHIHWLWRSAPVTATQVTSWMGGIATHNEYRDRSLLETWARVFGRVTGVYREVPINIYETLEQRQRGLKEEFDKFIRSHGEYLGNPYEGPRDPKYIPANLRRQQEEIQEGLDEMGSESPLDY